MSSTYHKRKAYFFFIRKDLNKPADLTETRENQISKKE